MAAHLSPSLNDLFLEELKTENHSQARARFESQPAEAAVVAEFLRRLEDSIADDLWKSVGGHWSEASVSAFRHQAMAKLVELYSAEPQEGILNLWVKVVRDFHREAEAASSGSMSGSVWGERRLEKKEKKPLTEEQKNSRRLFMYIWAMMQTAVVTKTAIFYFGLKSAEEGTTEGKIYVSLAIATTVVSLSFFAIRNYREKP